MSPIGMSVEEYLPKRKADSFFQSYGIDITFFTMFLNTQNIDMIFLYQRYNRFLFFIPCNPVKTFYVIAADS